MYRFPSPVFFNNNSKYDFPDRPFLTTMPRLRRIVEKDGTLNILNDADNKFKIFPINFLSMRWYSFVVLFCGIHLCSFIIFGAIYYVTDIYHKTGVNDNSEAMNNECFTEMGSFLAAYMFSLETQQTIGYGSPGITPDCPDAIAHLISHTLIGIILSAIFSGLFLAKFSKVGKGNSSIRFSRRAVISQRNGVLYFIFRIADTQVL